MDNLAMDLEKTLEKLDRVSTTSNTPLEKLQGCLDVIIDSTGAKRGFIMLYSSQMKQLEVYGVKNLDPETIFTSGEISLTILNKVYENENPVMSSSAIDDPRFMEHMSVILAGLRSFVCVPISGDEGLIGVIYMDNPSQKSAFNENHLEFLKKCCKRLTTIIVGSFPQIRPKPIAL